MGLKIIVFLVFLFGFKTLVAQDCYVDSFKATVDSPNINWEQFPEFTLPFSIIYGGPVNDTSPQTILNRGFTHIADPNYFRYLPKENRAFIYYGPSVTPEAQPFDLLKSPWGNNLDLYHEEWLRDIEYILSFQDGGKEITTDLFVFDIERQLKSDFQILNLKNETSTPEDIKVLDDAAFVQKYKEDLQAFYAHIVSFFRANGLNTELTKASAYADAPILNTFTNLQGNSWQEWQTDPSVLNFVSKDFEGNKAGGSYFDQLGITMPSTYYYYDYPHLFAGEYLSYLLFQIEVNQQWTTKDQIPFVWLRYSYTDAFKGQYIQPWMAEATAIFPFFWGAKGLWLWEDPTINDTESKATYEYFLNGLYRLSMFSDYFNKELEVIPSISAHQFNQEKSVVWKGIIKENKILIAAHNPFAGSETEETTITLTHGAWQKTITLKGYEVHLCEYDYDLVTGTEPDLTTVLFPNPVENNLNFSIPKSYSGTVQCTVFSLTGQRLFEETKTANNQSEIAFELSSLGTGTYIAKLKYGETEKRIRFLK